MDRNDFPLLVTWLMHKPADASNPRFSRMTWDEQRDRQMRWFDDSLATLDEAIGRGSIYNVDYKESRETLSRLIETGFDALRDAVRPTLSKAGDELLWDISLYGVHNIPATRKKLERSPLDEPGIARLRAFVEELSPIVQAYTDLKPRIVMGRKPRETSAPAQENPNKVVKTCPCCVRAIAVTPHALMALHGYRRPGAGFQTASCWGTRFPPLELSPKGLEAMIQQTEGLLTRTRSRLRRLSAQPCQINEILVQDRRNPKVSRTVTPKDADWAQVLSQRTTLLQHDADRAQRELVHLREALQAWAPETPVDPRLTALIGAPALARIQAEAAACVTAEPRGSGPRPRPK